MGDDLFKRWCGVSGCVRTVLALVSFVVALAADPVRFQQDLLPVTQLFQPAAHGALCGVILTS